jgi:hypothetical protein
MTTGIRYDVTLPSEWQTWIVDSLLADVPEDVVASAVTDGLGVPPQTAAARVRRIRKSAAYAAAERATRRLRKLESHLDALEAMRLLSSLSHHVLRRRQVTGHQFFETYYATSTPVLIEDFASGWPALSKWTPEYLRTAFGDARVEIMAGRDDDTRYEQNFDRHRHEMRFGDYVEDVLAADRSNNRYLVANNQLLRRPEFAALRDDVTIDTGIIDPDCFEGGVFFWLGPAGTVTPLHHDIENVLFVQIRGVKRFRLISPYQSHRVYNDVSVYSEVDAAQPDLIRHPRFAGVHQLETLVRPGEALLIPVGWWHHVESLEKSISLSFIRFVQPNDFAWNAPCLT